MKTFRHSTAQVIETAYLLNIRFFLLQTKPNKGAKEISIVCNYTAFFLSQCKIIDKCEVIRQQITATCPATTLSYKVSTMYYPQYCRATCRATNFHVTNCSNELYSHSSYFPSKGSEDNKWLLQDHEIAAHGRVEGHHFVVSNALKDTLEVGETINMDEPGKTFCTFPEGTRIKFTEITEV